MSAQIDPKTGDEGDALFRLLTAPPRRRWAGWIWLVVAVAGLLGGGAWLWSMNAGASDEVSYVTEPVTLGDLTVTVTATGTIEPTTKVEISSELAGTLASVEVDFNDHVVEGQVLARLDTSKITAQVANARAQKASAEARLVQAEASATEAADTLATQLELSSRGIASRKEMIAVEAANARARAAVDIARADLTLAGANLELAEADLEEAVIRSPIRGVVLDRITETGQIVGPNLNDPVLFTLAEDLARMELLADVDEADIGQIAVGQSAVFVVDAHDTLSFPATIRQVRYAPNVTEDVVSYTTVLAVENPDLLLRPGMTATATITVAEETGVLVVPNAALRYAPPKAQRTGGVSGLAGLVLPNMGSRNGPAGGGSGKSIWVLRDGVPVEVAVQIGATDGRNTMVVAEGLAEGDLAITDQQAASN